jgi:serine/threonine-protein phosphatase 4 regulatory subunit 1
VVKELVGMWKTGGLKGWREREMVAKTLTIYLDAVGKDGPGRDAVMQLLAFGLKDNAAAVREALIRKLVFFWATFANEPAVLKFLRSSVTELARSPSYRHRMTFIACQQALLVGLDGAAPSWLVNDENLTDLLRLGADNDPGVRIGVSRLAASLCGENFTL